MTRSKHIEMVADIISELAINGLFYRKAYNPKDPDTEKSKEALNSQLKNLKAHLCCAIEANEEQAEALMSAMKLQWKTSSSENP